VTAMAASESLSSGFVIPERGLSATNLLFFE